MLQFKINEVEIREKKRRNKSTRKTQCDILCKLQCNVAKASSGNIENLTEEGLILHTLQKQDGVLHFGLNLCASIIERNPLNKDTDLDEK